MWLFKLHLRCIAGQRRPGCNINVLDFINDHNIICIICILYIVYTSTNIKNINFVKINNFDTLINIICHLSKTRSIHFYENVFII